MASGNKPWMYLGFTLALILGVISASLVCLLLLIGPLIPNYTLQYTESEVRNLHQFPTPRVVMMDKIGKGYLFTLKQNPNLSFEIDWSFKLPRSGNIYNYYHGYSDRGHFLFEDKGQIYAIPSNMNQKMTVLHPPTKKHFTIQNSQIPDRFYASGHLVRAGNFIMIFGGYSMLPSFHAWWFTCSSSKNPGLTPSSSTAIWNIKKRIWIQGPYLPGKVDKCFFDSTGFALNQTHAVLLVVSQDSNDPYIESTEAGTSCIEAYVFSFETMEWEDTINCLIELGIVIDAARYDDTGYDKVPLVSTTFFNKEGEL